MTKSDSDSNEQEGIIPTEGGKLAKFSSSQLNLFEQIQVSLEKSDAVGRVRMAFADYFIEEKLMKRRRKK